MTEMQKLYKKETGKNSYISIDDDGNSEYSVYVECYTKDYIKWLENRAAEKKESPAIPQQPLCASAPQMPPCHDCTHLKCTLIITEQLGSMCSINDNWRHFTKR